MDSSGEYTPGPWKVLGRGSDRRVVDSNNITVASAAYNPGIDPRGIRTQEEQKANAHLIAAAPDLLAQLEALVVQIESSSVLIVPPNVWSAIEKARGRA